MSVPAILLDDRGPCPLCGRGLADLGRNTCSGCGRNLESHWDAIPAVQSRLNEIAPDWSRSDLEAWALPLPPLFAWAFQAKRFTILNHWALEAWWGSCARLWASLQGRRRQLIVNDIVVAGTRLAAVGDYEPRAALRVWGTRCAYEVDPYTQTVDEDEVLEPRPFEEFWHLRFTGAPKEDIPLRCEACGAPWRPPEEGCLACGCPVQGRPGPWILEAIHDTRKEGALAPFHGGLFSRSFHLKP